MSSDSPNNWGLILINVQNDFVQPTSAMAIPDANLLNPIWANLVMAARQAGMPIIGSAVVHDSDAPELSEQHLPDHCILGTEGAEYVSEVYLEGTTLYAPDSHQAATVLQQDLPSEVIIQQTSLDIWDNHLIEPLLEKCRKQGVQAWVIAGVPLEHSVKAAVLGLRSRNWPTYVVSDAVKGHGDSLMGEVLEEMQTAGASLIDSATAMIHWQKMALVESRF